MHRTGPLKNTLATIESNDKHLKGGACHPICSDSQLKHTLATKCCPVDDRKHSEGGRSRMQEVESAETALRMLAGRV